MTARSEGAQVWFPRRPPISDRAGGRWVPVLWISSVAVAGLVAVLAAVLDVGEAPPPRAQAGVAAAETALSLQVHLPSVGRGAPAELADLPGPIALQAGATAPPTDREEAALALTAQRYATHLIADAFSRPAAAVAPLETAEQIQVTMAIAAAAPTGVGQPDAASVASGAALRTYLGLAVDAPLPPFFVYEVRRGDSVTKLAARFGLQPESILFNNWEIRDADQLEAGSALRIPTVDGVVYTVRLGDALSDIAANYAAEVEAILAFPGNRLASADRIVEGQTILLVGGSASLGLAGGGAVFGVPEFRWPLGGILTDFFGSARSNRYGYHTGIDLSAPTGTFIGAAAAGQVIQAGWDGSFGLSVLVDHGGGVLTRYAHQSHIDVFLGEWVEPGDLIGFVGSTGYSRGPHLHFEIIIGGAPQDPLVWLNS